MTAWRVTASNLPVWLCVSSSVVTLLVVGWFPGKPCGGGAGRRWGRLRKRCRGTGLARGAAGGRTGAGGVVRIVVAAGRGAAAYGERRFCLFVFTWFGWEEKKR